MSEHDITERSGLETIIVRSKTKKFCKNNQVSIIGTLKEEFKLSHTTTGGSEFYQSVVAVSRPDGTEDSIQIMGSKSFLEKILDLKLKGRCVIIKGRMLSYLLFKRKDTKGNRLKLSVYLDYIQICNEFTAFNHNNYIYLEGTVCKSPVYRLVENDQEFTDLFITVQRNQETKDYIPCIAVRWLAIATRELEVGDKISLKGKIQSRKYLKISEDGSNTVETRVVQEVLILDIVEIEKKSKE